MAEINEELVEQLKKIADSLEDSSKFTEDMKEAVRSMREALQSVTDLSKTLSNNTKSSQEGFSSIVDAISKMKEGVGGVSAEMEKIALERQREKLLLDQTRMDDAAYSLSRKIALNEESDERRKLGIARTEQGALENAITKQMNEQHGLIKLINEASTERRRNLVLEGYEHDKVTNEMKKRSGPGAAFARAKLAGGDQAMEGLTGFKDMGGVMASLGSKLSGLASLGVGAAGVGGIMGLIVDSVQRRESFQAFGQQASQAFDTLGEGGAKAAGTLGGLTRGLTRDFAASQAAVATVTKSLAEFGIGAEEAMQKIEGVSTGYGNNMVTATLSVDKAFEMAEGTMAKLAGTMARDFNTTAQESFIYLTNVGTAAKEAGLNAAQFMQSTMQASSALKMLNANGKDIMDLQLGFSKSMVSSGFGTQFSGQMAASAATSVAGGIAGLNEGFAAVIGERMGMGNGLDAMMAMKNPFSRGAENQLDISDVVREIRGIAQETGSTPNEQRFFLQKMGFNEAGSEAILTAFDELDKTGQLSEASQKEIAKGLRSESEKTSSIDRAVNLIKDGFLDIGLGLLEAILSIGKATYGAIMGFYSMVMSWINSSDKDMSKQYGDEADAYLEYGSKALGGLNISKDLIVQGVKKVVEGGEKGVGILMESENLTSMTKINSLAEKRKALEYARAPMTDGDDDSPKSRATYKKIAVVRGKRKVVRPEEEDEKQDGSVSQ